MARKVPFIVRESLESLKKKLLIYEGRPGTSKSTLQKIQLFICILEMNGPSNKKLSQLMGISSSTIQYWKVKYKKALMGQAVPLKTVITKVKTKKVETMVSEPIYSESELTNSSPINLLIKDMRPEGRKKRIIITPELQNKISVYLNESSQKQFTYTELYNLLTSKFNFQIEFSTLRKYLYENHYTSIRKRGATKKSVGKTKQRKKADVKKITNDFLKKRKYRDQLDWFCRNIRIIEILQKHEIIWNRIGKEDAKHIKLVEIITDLIKEDRLYNSKTNYIIRLTRKFPTEFRRITEEYYELKIRLSQSRRKGLKL